MSESILVPVLGESVTEATVAKWLKNEGDKINADEAIVELETDKVNVEVPAPSNGTLEKISYCIKLGADNGSLRHERPFEDIKKWAPNGVDIILDPVGGEYFEDNLNVLSIEGRLLLIGLMGGTKSEINLGLVLMKRQRIIGSTIRARSPSVKGNVMNDLYEKVWPHFKSKKIRPIIHKTMNIEQANQAHEIMEKNQNIGKIVLKIS